MKTETVKTKLADLVLDFDLYPRSQIDAHHAHNLVEAIQSGAELPLIIADKKSKRITDGFHRHRAYSRIYGPEHQVDVLFKSYKDDAAMFLDAMRYNAGHGRSLTTFDRSHCVLRAERLGISVDQVAAALSLTKESVGALRTERVGELRLAKPAANGSKDSMIVTQIPLKRTIQHMAGQQLTQAQVTANDKLSGMEQLFYVNQLITLIENDLLDLENEKLMSGLAKLADLMKRSVRRRKAA